MLSANFTQINSFYFSFGFYFYPEFFCRENVIKADGQF